MWISNWGAGQLLCRAAGGVTRRFDVQLQGEMHLATLHWQGLNCRPSRGRHADRRLEE